MTIHLGDPARHFFMTRSVARVMGLDLHAALHGGTLSPETYAGMVTCLSGVCSCRSLRKLVVATGADFRHSTSGMLQHRHLLPAA